MKTKLFLLLAVTIAAASLLYPFRSAWATKPFERDMLYSNISRIAVDSAGFLYTITDSKRTILKTDQNEKFIYAVSSNDGAAPDTIRLFNSIAADNTGEAYALITVLDSFGLKVLGEQIVKITADGSKVSKLFEVTYTAADNLLRVGNIQSLTVKV